MKAQLLFYEKEYIGKNFVLEMAIWSVPKKDVARFPDGYKYRLILVDTKTQRKVLMDNHHPKSHHTHFDDLEVDYDFKNLETLVKDFKIFCKKHLGVSL